MRWEWQAFERTRGNDTPPFCSEELLSTTSNVFYEGEIDEIDDGVVML